MKLFKLSFSGKSIFAFTLFLTFVSSFYYYYYGSSDDLDFLGRKSYDSIKTDVFIDGESNIKSIWIVVVATKAPGEVISFLSKLVDAQVLVVGLSSSTSDWTHPNTIYLSIEMQESLGYAITKSIPKDSYNRKLIGYLYAIEHGAKYIYDTDDDVKHEFKSLKDYFIFNESSFGLTANRISSDLSIFNTFDHFGQPNMWPRGLYPEVIRDTIGNEYTVSKHKTSVVQHGLLKGKGDVDSTLRSTKNRLYKDVNIDFDNLAPPVELPRDMMAPFNSMNTLFHYKAFWGLYLPITVSSRYTDVIRSFWTQRLMMLFDDTVTFIGPQASLNRDFSTWFNLNEDQQMHSKLKSAIGHILFWTCWKLTLYDCALDLTNRMREMGIWSGQEMSLVSDWLNDLKKVGYKEPTEMIEMTVTDDDSPIDAFDIRFVPTIDKTVDSDSLCCTDRDRKIYNQADSLSNLNGFCNNALSSIVINYPKNAKPIGKYILLVTFNHLTVPSNILIMKHFYGHYFKHVVFCGNKILANLFNHKSDFERFDSITFVDYDTQRGLFHHQCINRVIEMNFNTDGILLMSDDVMLKYWRLHLDLNFDKMWFTRKVACWEEMDAKNTMSVPEQKWVWNGRWGLKTLFKTFDELNGIINGSIPASDENKLMASDYLDKLVRNYENKKEFYRACWGQSDIFYLPKSTFKRFHYITSIYQHHNVFLELAVGTVLSGLAPVNEIDLLKGGYQWECNHCFFFDWETSRVQSVYETFPHFYHPVKISTLMTGAGHDNFCNIFIKDKFLNDAKIYQ